MFREICENVSRLLYFDNKILEKYERIETDKEITLDSGAKYSPVATLTDEYGGRAQIITSDGCYVLCLIQENGTYKKTAYIFPEAHEALKDLPSPEEVELARVRGYKKSV